MSDWLDKHPDAMLVLTGAPGEEAMQFEHSQVLCMAGKMALRDVFCLSQYVDLAVGPESSVINAAACFDTPKIVLLSHSTHTNLCKYWTNHQCLEPQNVPCYPCHQLHYTKESCPIISIIDPQTNHSYWDGPACSGAGISGERVQAAIDKVYDVWRAKRTAATA
jgi:ADP-heptose:LPS heptosyltransferase